MYKRQPWWQMERDGLICPADQDLSADMLEYAIDALAAAGYRHYEISNFARPGFESQHNLAYWRRENYLGLGVAAAGCMLNYRYYNHRTLADYQTMLELSLIHIFLLYQQIRWTSCFPRRRNGTMPSWNE